MFDSLPALGPELKGFSASQAVIRGSTSVDKYRQVWWCSPQSVCTLEIQIKVPIHESSDSGVLLLTDSGVRSIPVVGGVVDTEIPARSNESGMAKIGFVYSSLVAGSPQKLEGSRVYEEVDGHLEFIQSKVLLRQERSFFPDSVSVFSGEDGDFFVSEARKYLKVDNGSAFSQRFAVYDDMSRKIIKCPAKTSCWILQKAWGGSKNLVVQTNEVVSPCGIVSCDFISPRFFRRKVSR